MCVNGHKMFIVPSDPMYTEYDNHVAIIVLKLAVVFKLPNLSDKIVIKWNLCSTEKNPIPPSFLMTD